MGWLDHGGLGFNYRLSDLAAALGVAQLERLDAMLARRSVVASLYEQGLTGVEGVSTPIAARGNERRSWFPSRPAVDRSWGFLDMVPAESRSTTGSSVSRLACRQRQR